MKNLTRWLCALLFLAILFPSFAKAGDNPVLFKEFVYGMSPQEVAERSGATACGEEGLEDCLCAPKQVSFSREDWGQVFKFHKDRLAQVMLVKKEFDRDAYASLIKGITNLKYAPAFMRSGDEDFDILEQLYKFGGKEIKTKINAFEQKALRGENDFSLVFASEQFLKQTMQSDKKESFFTALEQAPADLRIIEIHVSNGVLLAVFTTPIAIKQDILKSMQGIKEKF